MSHAATTHWRAVQRAFSITRQLGHNVHAGQQEVVVVLFSWPLGPKFFEYDHALLNVEPASDGFKKLAQLLQAQV